MSDFIQEGTSKTPDIRFDANNNKLWLKGRSIPENAAEFYGPLYSFLDDLLASKNAHFIVEFRLEYFNTSSSKSILDIFRKFESAVKLQRCSVEVIWCYELDDEDMREAGEDYNAITGLPFQYLAVDKL
jgi:hypothetical protein